MGFAKAGRKAVFGDDDGKHAKSKIFRGMPGAR
jgi:hypothetical protein